MSPLKHKPPYVHSIFHSFLPSLCSKNNESQIALLCVRFLCVGRAEIQTPILYTITVDVTFIIWQARRESAQIHPTARRCNTRFQLVG